MTTTHATGGGRRFRPAAARLLLLGLLLTGCATPQAMPVSSTPTSSAPAPSVSTEAAEPSQAGMSRSEPTGIHIPKIGARSSLIPLGLNADGTVEVAPVSQPLQASWYRDSPTPGEPGPAVVLGHIDGTSGPGIFYRLRELRPGDSVEITRKDGTTARFAVTRVQQVSKAEFPTDAVYGDTTEPELRLITCGGAFDKNSGNYRDNIIVYATLKDTDNGT